VSLLPTFLAARLSGTLDEVEAVVAAVEQAGGVTAALETVHPADAKGAVGLEGALRSMRRRVRAVHAALLAIVTLMPERFVGVMPTVLGLRAALSTQRVLVTLREIATRHLAALPTPLGLSARASACKELDSEGPHEVGAVPDGRITEGAAARCRIGRPRCIDRRPTCNRRMNPCSPTSTKRAARWLCFATA